MHILIKSDNEKKGVIIITHKEVGFIDNFIKHLKNYIVLMHIGFNTRIPERNYISLYLIADSRCNKKNYIPFTSRNFLSKNLVNKRENTIEDCNELFKKYNLPVIDFKFDFIYVGRCVDIKKTTDILNFCDKSPNYRCLFVILKHKSNDYYNKFIKKVKQIKNKNIYVLDTHRIPTENKIFLGFTQKELSILYNNSKVYIHGCDSEGESRTIQEALICGCIIMAKINMKGGGLDYLNQSNSVLYKDKNALEKMKEALKKYESYSYDIEIEKKLNEKYTCEKFCKLIYERYFTDKMTFEEFFSKCNIENLAFSLPAHNLSVPWFIKGRLTADIRSIYQFKIFLNYISLTQ